MFQLKGDPNGIFNEYETSFVAKDFHQNLFVTTKKLSPVVKPVTIRVILTIALTYCWVLQQIDIHNAFLNGFREEEEYMTQPLGCDSADKSLLV